LIDCSSCIESTIYVTTESLLCYLDYCPVFFLYVDPSFLMAFVSVNSLKQKQDSRFVIKRLDDINAFIIVPLKMELKSSVGVWIDVNASINTVNPYF